MQFLLSMANYPYLHHQISYLYLTCIFNKMMYICKYLHVSVDRYLHTSSSEAANINYLV